MLGFLKRRLLPREHRPPLAPHERVLAWSFVDGEPLVATNLGLWLGGTHTGWHDIAKAVWDGTALTVIKSVTVEPREGYTVIANDVPVRYVLSEPGHVPHQVRLRVTSSVRHPSHHGLPGGGGVWVAARRVPGIDGLSWIVRYDAGTDGTDPGVIEATDAIVRETQWRVVGPSE
jgi:hypothetical protein